MKKLLLIAIGLLWLQTAEAQLFKKLTDKIKDKVSDKINRKVDDKVNQTVDKTVNKAEKILTDTTSKSKKAAKKEQTAVDTLSTDTVANHQLLGDNRKRKNDAAKQKAKKQ